MGAHRATQRGSDLERADDEAAAEALEGHGTADEAKEVVQRMMTSDDLNAAQETLNKGCEMFRKSAILQVFIARFHFTYTRNKHLHMRYYGGSGNKQKLHSHPAPLQSPTTCIASSSQPRHQLYGVPCAPGRRRIWSSRLAPQRPCTNRLREAPLGRAQARLRCHQGAGGLLGGTGGAAAKHGRQWVGA